MTKTSWSSSISMAPILRLNYEVPVGIRYLEDFLPKFKIKEGRKVFSSFPYFDPKFRIF